MRKITKLLIYTDGACSGNPGPGGFGLQMQVNFENGAQGLWIQSEYTSATTNNAQELSAMLMAMYLAYNIARKGVEIEEIEIISDSTYCVKGVTEWMPNWAVKGFCRDGSPIPNQSLWQTVYVLFNLLEKNLNLEVKVTWVKGHATDAGNNTVDTLAVNAYREKTGRYEWRLQNG